MNGWMDQPSHGSAGPLARLQQISLNPRKTSLLSR